MSAFDQVTKSDETNNEQTNIEQQSTFEQLVGEGKKFNDPESLAKGKMESDQFIEQLKTELQGLREELDKRMTSEQVLEQIREQRSSTETTGENTTPSLSEEELTGLIKKTLDSTRSEEVSQQNIRKVDQDLVQRFGDKAGDWVVSKAKELGVSVDWLQSTAAHSPAAFYNAVGFNQTNKTSPGATTSSVNTEVMGSTNTGPAPRTKAWFDQIKKESPKKYWSPQIQNELFKARQELGSEKFYS